MNNQTVITKLQQRLDKLASEDYQNIEVWMLVEAFNKAQMSWIRKQIEGINQTRSGAEGSIRKIDDLQFILTTVPQSQSSLTDYGIYWSFTLPADYFGWCRVSASAKTECCPTIPLRTIFESVEADRDINLNDNGKQPSFEWLTTFATVSNSEIKIYTNDLFDIQDVSLTYYRYPKNIQITGVTDVYTGEIPSVDVNCEATDQVVELMIDEAVSIISGDLKDYQRQQDITQTNERNN
jgi:hypothetical protein